MAFHQKCDGTVRRDCLKLGLGALLGGGFVDALRLGGNAATVSSQAAGRASSQPHTSVILIWLDGGPSHFETFDPKPEAPAEIRGEFDAIATKTPGVFFSENMQRLASISDKFTIVRSLRHNQNNHGAGNHYMMTGAPTRIPVSCGAFVSFHPSYGAVTSAERGAPDGLPPYFSMPSMARSGGPNFLGSKHAPFVVGGDPNSDSFRVRDVSLPAGLEEGRVVNRRELRRKFDSLKRFHERAAADPVLGVDENVHQAVSLMTSAKAQEAFEIQKEPEHVRSKYGRSAIGQRALLARRLVEAGVPFVTITHGGWDDHANIFSRFKKRADNFEPVIAALIEDLDERGLLDTTLVIMMGEFGRTPAITTLSGQSAAGRNHWSNAMSILVAGCGTPGGQIIGATDRNGYTAVDNVYGPENLASSIYLKLGIQPDKILYNRTGRPVHLVSDPRPIKEIM